MAIARRMAALALVALAAPVPAASVTGPVVRAPFGSVRGEAAQDVNIFRGIPYALPPEGTQRWKPPVALPDWQEVRDARQFGAACQQPAAPASSIYAETYPAMGEDCLSLNLWTPAKARNAPVFVWIHGGNLIRGSSQQGLFDGSELAKRGIIVVSINYRLGVFGYLAHPELSAESPHNASGNFGLMDQTLALQWVQRNIGAFGGDRRAVTIAGESAGGLAILHLLASPQARGLFSKAIVQSASLMNIAELKQARFGMPSAEDLGQRLMLRMGAKNLAELRAIDPIRLTALAQQAGFASSAVVDGFMLKRQLIDTFERGEQAPVPLMTGFTTGEIRTMQSILPGLPNAASFADGRYEATIRAGYSELADEFLRLYPASEFGERILAATRDGFFGWTSQRLVREQARLGKPAYLYLFDHGYPAADEGGMHAFHASEVPYMFGSLKRLTPLWPKIPDTSVERKLSRAMVDYWASFVRTGVPTAKGQPTWPAHNKAAAYMLFAGKPQVERNLFEDRYRLHDQVVCRRRAAGNVPWNWNVGVSSPPLPPAQENCK